MTNLISPYADLNPQSRQWWKRSQRVLAGGGQAHRRTGKYTLRGAPHFATRAKGAYFWDVDGRQFLDYLLGYGPILIGHCDPDVNEAVRRQMEEGTIFSLEHPTVIEFDEELCRLIPCAEMVINLIGGSSATTAAVRCASVHTKREKIVRCGYPGSALVGKRAILEARADTFIGATFHGDLLSIAAARVVLRIMRERDGIAHIDRLGKRLMDGLNDVFVASGYPLRVRGWPAMPELMQTDAPPEFAGKVITEWCAAMQRRGVYMTGHCWFISLAHTVEDIERTIAAGKEAVQEAFTVLRNGPELPYL